MRSARNGSETPLPSRGRKWACQSLTRIQIGRAASQPASHARAVAMLGRRGGERRQQSTLSSPLPVRLPNTRPSQAPSCGSTLGPTLDRVATPKQKGRLNDSLSLPMAQRSVAGAAAEVKKHNHTGRNCMIASGMLTIKHLTLAPLVVPSPARSDWRYRGRGNPCLQIQRYSTRPLP